VCILFISFYLCKLPKSNLTNANILCLVRFGSDRNKLVQLLIRNSGSQTIRSLVMSWVVVLVKVVGTHLVLSVLLTVLVSKQICYSTFELIFFCLHGAVIHMSLRVLSNGWDRGQRSPLFWFVQYNTVECSLIITHFLLLYWVSGVICHYPFTHCCNYMILQAVVSKI